MASELQQEETDSSLAPDIIGIPYPQSRLSRVFISLTYPPDLRLRIGKLIGREKTVFEIVAGYSRYVTFFDPTNSYNVIDINPVFLNRTQREGKSIREADLFDAAAYIESDVVLLVDAVHHVPEELLPDLFDLVFANAREKVLIVEPAFPNFSERYGILGVVLDKTFLWLDNNGFNTPQHWFSPAKYQGFFRAGFGSALGRNFALHYENLAYHHIAMYRRIA